MLFIGPALKCKNEMVETLIDTIGCPKCEPLFRNTSQFCSICGRACTDIKISQKIPKTDKFLSEEINQDSLCLFARYDDHAIFVPNQFRDNPRKFCHGSLENFFIDQSELEIEKCKIWFYRSFSVEIEKAYAYFKDAEIIWCICRGNVS